MTASPLLTQLETEPDRLVELTTLYELSESLASARSLHEGLGQAMLLLSRHPGALRGALTLLDDETGEKILKLISTLEDNDDVQNVYANFEISDALVAKMGG